MKDRLTPKQDKFIQVYLETGNATEAYRQAYNTKTLSSNAVHVNASRLLDNAKVALRLDEIRAENAKNMEITMEYLTQSMRDACQMALDQGKANEYGQNLERLAKLTGQWTDKQQVTHEGQSPEAWLEEYKRDLEQRERKVVRLEDESVTYRGKLQ